MEPKSVYELLQLALSKEKASIQFYHDLSRLMQNASTKSLFEVLIQQEITHAKQLELEVEKMGMVVKEMDEESFLDDSEEELNKRIQVDNEAVQMTFLDGLRLAIKKERAAFQLYAQLLGQTRDRELQDVVMALAEEEMRHVLQFEREYEALTHHKD